MLCGLDCRGEGLNTKLPGCGPEASIGLTALGHQGLNKQIGIGL